MRKSCEKACRPALRLGGKLRTRAAPLLRMMKAGAARSMASRFRIDPDSQPRPTRLNAVFCANFRGVCAECPNRLGVGVGEIGPTRNQCRLPPLAAETIAALSRCRRLTRRERDVLTLCCGGAKNAVIARTLGISNSAVRRHLRNLHKKTNTSDKAELILNLWYSSTSCPEPVASPVRRSRSRSRRRIASPRRPSVS